VAEVSDHFQKTAPKGEIVVVVEGAGKKDEETV
jgi:16S rRNA C1402 (ribose-2'-O) methylase RsmI